MDLYAYEEEEYTDEQRAEEAVEDDNETIWDRITADIFIVSEGSEDFTDVEKVNLMAQAVTNEIKANVDGAIDESKSCWSWATQGFEDSAVPETAALEYLSHRVNYPVRGGVKNHAAAVATVAGDNADIAAYLNNRQAELQGIMAQWEAKAQEGELEEGNGIAQLELMRLHLTDQGFNVLAQGSNADWYICMHEEKGKVGWEHWRIKTDAANIGETFPYREGAGKYLAFHDSEVNMGGDADFRHEVPVEDIQDAQKAIIQRAFLTKKRELLVALGIIDDDESDESEDG